MRRLPLWVGFSIAFIMALLEGALFPELRLLPFAPFLALSYYRLSFPGALWAALGTGLLFDLMTSEMRFGFYALNFLLVTIIFYHQKKHFFEDKSVAFSLYTALISLGSTLLLFPFHDLSFSLPSLFSDLIVMPLLDGVYAFLWFTTPAKLYNYLKKRHEETI
jgi:rod shape-determining protein MreD